MPGDHEPTSDKLLKLHGDPQSSQSYPPETHHFSAKDIDQIGLYAVIVVVSGLVWSPTTSGNELMVVVRPLRLSADRYRRNSPRSRRSLYFML